MGYDGGIIYLANQEEADADQNSDGREDSSCNAQGARHREQESGDLDDALVEPWDFIGHHGT